MLFEDNKGNLLTPDEIDELSPWEIGFGNCSVIYKDEVIAA